MIIKHIKEAWDLIEMLFLILFPIIFIKFFPVWWKRFKQHFR